MRPCTTRPRTGYWTSTILVWGIGDLSCCFYCWQDRPTGEGLITSSCAPRNVRTETTSEWEGREKKR